MKTCYGRKIFQDIFNASFVTFLLLFIIEQFEHGFASNYFNLGYLLLAVLISGIITVLFPFKKEKDKIWQPGGAESRSKYWPYVIALFLSFVLYQQLKPLGAAAILLTMAGLIVFIMIARILLSSDD